VPELIEEKNEKVTVVAVLQAIKGKGEELERELIALVPPTRQEPGCINYDLHRSSEDPTMYMFYENWVNKKALDQHLEMPYLKEFSKKADRLLKKPIELSLYRKISD